MTSFHRQRWLLQTDSFVWPVDWNPKYFIYRHYSKRENQEPPTICEAGTSKPLEFLLDKFLKQIIHYRNWYSLELISYFDHLIFLTS